MALRRVPIGTIIDAMERRNEVASFTPRGTDLQLPGLERFVPPQRRFPLEGVAPEAVPRSGGAPNSREHMGPRPGGQHAGWDIPAKIGQPILAPADGQILKMGTMQGYGQFVDMKFDDGTVHRVAHLGDMSKGGTTSPFSKDLKPGDSFKAGTPIGFAGYSGNATKDFPHAHWETFKDDNDYNRYGFGNSRETAGARLDPRTYFTEGKEAAINKYLELHGMAGAQPQPGKDFSSQGRYSDLVDKYSKSSGVSPEALKTFIQIESGGKPNAQTGSYQGLLQISPKQAAQFGEPGANLKDPETNLRVGSRILADTYSQLQKGLGRDPSLGEFYLGHQQGVAGALAHVKNPDRPAWQNMQEAAKSSPEWAQRAIMGNLTNADKLQIGGDVNKLTSGQFADIWNKRVARIAGQSVPQTAQAPGAANAPPPPPPSSIASPANEPSIAAAARAGEGAEPARGPIQPAITPEEPAQAGRFAQPQLAKLAPPPPSPGGNEPSIAARQDQMTQEAQPGAPSGSAPITEMPGTVITSQAVPPDALAPRQDAPDAYGGNAEVASGGSSGAVSSALDSWQPGQPIMPALLGDIFGGGGGGGGLFGLGGGRGGGFKNLVQSYTPSPDSIIPAAGPEQTVLPTSLPPPPPPPPPTPPGMQNFAQMQRRRHTGR